MTVHIHLDITDSSMDDRAIGMAVAHAGRPDPETVRRSVPSAWPGSWAKSADSSGPTQLSTSIFHFPVETGEFDARSGYRDGRRTCRPAGPRDCPSVCAVGMAGQLGWGCRLEWALHPTRACGHSVYLGSGDAERARI